MPPVNGQTGKVVADLPISVGKFLLGSLIAAIPVYILLCLLTVLTPGMTLTIVGVACDYRKYLLLTGADHDCCKGSRYRG